MRVAYRSGPVMVDIRSLRARTLATGYSAARLCGDLAYSMLYW